MSSYSDPDNLDPRGAPEMRVTPNQNRLLANRENAKKSTGPTSDAGRAVTSLNAVKHGLTGNTVLLDSDDADAYQQRLDEYTDQFKPVTLEERRLVQAIHDGAWRLDRILNRESTVYAKGRIELQFCFSEIPEDQRKSFIELEITERNAKQLRNYHLLEGRLQRQRAKDLAALRLLIKERKAEEKTNETEAANTDPKQQPSTLVSESRVGFEFSTPETSSSQPQILDPDCIEEAA